jgi:hypothetical protein
VLEYVFRPMRLRPMWPMYGTYIATLLGLALMIENHFPTEMLAMGFMNVAGSMSSCYVATGE